MSDEPSPQDGQAPSDEATPQAGTPRDPVRRYTRIVFVTLIVLFAWYVAADRVAPWTDQARVDGFIVAVTPKISGWVTAVNVAQDQGVEAGDVLVEIDRKSYELALKSAEANLERAGQDTGADTAAVAAAEAAVDTKEAMLRQAQANMDRLQRIYDADPGAVSAAARDAAHAARDAAKAEEANSRADLEKTKQTLGQSGEDNARIREAVAQFDQARIDLAATRLVAPARGGISNLKVFPGHYAKAGAPLMTFVSGTDVWIEAYLRENSLANIRKGDPVDIALDTAPGKIWRGTVTSRGYAVQKPTQGEPGGLVTVKTSSGWLRDAQRFPVTIRFEDDSARSFRIIGGQADVQIYTSSSNSVLNMLGRAWIRFMSLLSYVY